MVFAFFKERQPVVSSMLGIPLRIQVETQVETDEGRYSHGLPVPWLLTVAVLTSAIDHHPPLCHPKSIMSLPRSNYDPRRVCLNPFPNFDLGKHRRTAGVYLAGALVRFYVIMTLTTLF